MLKKFARGFKRFEIGFLTALFIVAFLVIALQATSRYVFSAPVIWTDEVSTLLQMLIAFLGIGYGIRTKTHIRIDSISNRFPPVVQQLLSIVFDLLFIALCVVLIQDGWKYAMSVWDVSFGTFALGKGKMFLAVSVGYALALVYTVMDIVDSVRMLMKKDPVFCFGKEE